MTLADELSLAFIAWCESEGVAARTIDRRATTLRSVGNAGAASREDLEAWWTSRSDLAPSTRATDLANLRTFYRWCEVWEHRADNPSKRIQRPKVPNNLPKPVSERDLDKLLEHYQDDNPAVYRAVVLGSQLGLRVAEAAALRWRDVDPDAGAVDVRGKGSKERRLPIDDDVLAALGPRGGAEESVVTGTLDVLTADALRLRVNRAIRAAGVKATFHKLRHRFGSAAYRDNQDIAAVARLMGHASITTTAGYAAAADNAARSIARAVVSPRLHRRRRDYS